MLYPYGAPYSFSDPSPQKKSLSVAYHCYTKSCLIFLSCFFDMPPGDYNHTLNVWLNESPISWSKSWQLLLFFFLRTFPVPQLLCKSSMCPGLVSTHAGGPVWDFWVHLAGAPSSLPLGYSLQCVFITVNQHSSLTFWERGHLLPSASHFFFSCYALDFTTGSLNPGSKQPSWDIIPQETNVSTPTLDYSSSQKLPEIFISQIGVIMRKQRGKLGDNICEHS